MSSTNQNQEPEPGGQEAGETNPDHLSLAPEAGSAPRDESSDTQAQNSESISHTSEGQVENGDTELGREDGRDFVGANIEARSETETYVEYVQELVTKNPRLRHVLEFLKSNENDDEPPTYVCFFGVVMTHTPGNGFIVSIRTERRQPPINAIYQTFDSALCLGKQSPKEDHVLLIRDIQPAGAKFLGHYLKVQPRFLERYLNRDATFESYGSSCFVFEYPETYQSTRPSEARTVGELVGNPNCQYPGSLVRLWKSIYGHFQRIVWIVYRDSISNHEIHILLTDSLPTINEIARNTTFHLGQPLQSYQQYSESEARVIPDNRTHCLDSLELTLSAGPSGKNPAAPLVGIAITNFLREKWAVMLQYVQEEISESKAPLSGNLKEIEEVLQRKHDFEKLKRTISAVITSAQHTPNFNKKSQSFKDLRNYERIIQGWATQLEKVSNSMLGMLAISESLKASKQSTRSQNIQLLAFIFIPLSTISSIYGMNVAEIVNGKPPMWNFGVAAVAATVGAVFVALIYHAGATSKIWFVAAIRDAPGDFMVDVLVLFLSLVLKSVFFILGVVPLVVVFVFICVFGVIAFVVGFLVASVLSIFQIILRGNNNEDKHTALHDWLVMIFLVFAPIISIASGLLVWGETMYFYDITHPLNFSREFKVRRRYRWTRRKQADITPKMEVVSFACTVM